MGNVRTKASSLMVVYTIHSGANPELSVAALVFGWSGPYHWSGSHYTLLPEEEEPQGSAACKVILIVSLHSSEHVQKGLAAM